MIPLVTVNHTRKLLVAVSAVYVLTYSFQISAQAGFKTTAAIATQDIGWPRQVRNYKEALVHYQPQLDGWKDHQILTGRMAFALTPTGKPVVHGVASMKCITIINKPGIFRFEN